MGGEGPVSYLAVSQYAEDHGISGEDFWTFRSLMSAIDSEWLEHAAREAKRKEAEKK